MHTQTQGCVERFNKTITQKISLMISESDEKKWINMLKKCVFIYNNEWHRAINAKPFFIFRGMTGERLTKTDISIQIYEDSIPEPVEIPKVDESYREKYIKSSLSSNYLIKYKKGDEVFILKDFEIT
ncbi:hypothetical protein DMUE_1242 [Dictyocoela muelleri]|nr:hypothetical protein DMUE_1242 [Dictyocoela muelleri]